MGSLSLLLAACGADGAPPPQAPAAPVHLEMKLARASGSHDVIATATLRDAAGAVSKALPVAFAIDGGDASMGPIAANADGSQSVTFTPAHDNQVLAISASAGAFQASKKALVLAVMDDGWDQPESVDGLVNTPGIEDGISVSPDGEWLFVSTYSPVDIYCCYFGCNAKMPLEPSGPSCETAIGPYDAPARPGMLGADRIVSPTHILDRCPNLGIPATGEETTFALPPVAAYGFHRMADDSYQAPFVIGFDDDGFPSSPFGIDFVSAPAGGKAEVVFAYDDPITQGAADTQPDIYTTTLTLGAPNILGAYSHSSKGVAETGFLPTQLKLETLAGQQGNPCFRNGRLWWDDETEMDKQLYYADATGTLPNATFSAKKVVGLSEKGKSEIQPFFDGVDGKSLYYNRDGHLVVSELIGDDPSLAAAWTPRTVIVGTGIQTPKTDAILGLGEPTVAHFDGQMWLYFVYVTKTSTGYDANAGRVRRKTTAP